MCRKMILSVIVVVTGTCLVGVAGAVEILVYTFDEGSGATAFDQTGNGRDGVITDATWQAGGFNGSGSALSFQGGAKVEDDDGEAFLNGLEALTMAAWVRSNILSSDRGIFNGENPDGGDNVCTMRYDSSGANFGGTNVMKMAVTTGGGESQLESSSGVQTTEWQHVAMTWESGGLIRLYINGEEDMGVNRNNPNNSGTIDGCDTFIVGQGAKDQSNSWDGLIDEVRLFDAALTAEELQLVMLGVAKEVAKSPVPGDGAADVNRDSDVSWEAGDFAATHNVFLSTSFDDVNDATVGDPGAAVVGQGLADTTFDPGRLAFDQTYYWRVDEVNSAPDSTVFKGDVWSFTIEPFSIPIVDLTATASRSFGASGPEKTIDGSGLVDDLHGTSAGDMWISAGVPATLEYAFDRAYKLHELWIWNSNQLIEAFVGFGAKDVVIEHSLDGENWTVLDGVGPL
ncbi:MAG: LamG domain-containing protein, partial [Planctomycetes bacterium]|nr:LamG domain-containing protein [Planctomycetota bacterium]